MKCLTLTFVLLFIVSSCQKQEIGSGDSPRQGMTEGKNGKTKKTATKSDQDGGEPSPSEPGSGNAALEEGEAFFIETLKPALENSKAPRCLNCHTDPDQLAPPGIQGPIEIWEYQHMKKILAEGEFSNDNKLYNRFLGLEVHTGNTICDNERSPLCILVVDWWKSEFGTNGASRLGEILGVSPIGIVEGYAKDIEDENKNFAVRLYLDGDNQTGTMIGEEQAVKSVKIRGVYKNFGFKIQIPAVDPSKMVHLP